MSTQRYIVHPTRYERDDYILRTLLRDAPDALPLPLLRRTDWHVCEIALTDLQGFDASHEDATASCFAEALRDGAAIEPVLVLGPEMRLVVGHRRVRALAALGEQRVLAYHGEMI